MKLCYAGWPQSGMVWHQPTTCNYQGPRTKLLPCKLRRKIGFCQQILRLSGLVNSSSLNPAQPWLVFLQFLFFPTPPTAADLKETAISCCCPYRSDCRAVKRPASKVKIQQLPYVHRTLNLQFLPKHCTWPTCAQPFCFVWFKRPAFRDSIAEMWLVVKISPFLGSYYNTAPIF